MDDLAAPVEVRNPAADCLTVLDVLELRAARDGDRTAFTCLARGEVPDEALTFGELYHRAQSVAAYLQSRLSRGSSVVLVFPNEIAFIPAFMGCLMAGMVAVPLAAPRNARGMERLEVLAEVANAPLAIASSGLRTRLEKMGQESQTLDWLYSDELPDGLASAWHRPAITPDTIAVLQFTSGSTGLPKGVMVSHGNILHNCRMLESECGTGPDLRMATWLPYFHDWGLVGCMIFPFYAGGASYFMDPADFLRRPLRWMEAAHHYRATVVCAPNFAYEQSAAAAEDEAPHLDLSSIRLAMLGAEPIRQETLDRFARAFARAGFRREALYPSYGLAESTLIVTGTDRARGPAYLTLDRAALEAGHAVHSDKGDARTFVSCGRPLLDQRVAIVDPETGLRRGPMEIGEVWIAGPSVTQGYWQRPDETVANFQGEIAGEPGPRYLRTGDLGFMDGPDLYVCGRLKDLIIKAGANYFAEDIEHSVDGCHPGLRPGCGAAFGVDVDGTERLVVVHEVNYGPKPDLQAVTGAIQKAVSRDHDVLADAVAVLKPGTLEKTSSGKIRRRHTKVQFSANALEPLTLWKAW